MKKKKSAGKFILKVAKEISREPKADRKGLSAVMTKAADRTLLLRKRTRRLTRGVRAAGTAWKVLKKVL